MLSVTSGRRRHWAPLQKANASPSPNANDLHSKRVSRVESIRNLFSRNDRTSDSEADTRSDSDVSQTDLRKIGTTKNAKTLRGKKRLKSISDNIALNQQQLTDYLTLLQLSPEEFQDMLSDLTSSETKRTHKSRRLGILSEERSTPKQSRKFRGVRNIFSMRSSSKSDDENEMKRDSKSKRTVSSGSLTNITEFLANTKKTMSLSEISSVLNSMIIKSDESGYGSDSTRTGTESPGGSIKSQTSDMVVTGSPTKNHSTLTPSTNLYKNENDDTDTAEEDDEDDMRVTRKAKRTLTRTTSKIKRARSNSEETDQINLSKRSSRPVGTKRSYNSMSNGNGDELKMTVEELNRTFNEKLDKLILEFNTSMAQHTSTFKSKEISRQPLLEKEFKCVRLRLDKEDEAPGVCIAPKNANEQSTPYVITEILPGSAAERYVYSLIACR